MDSPRRVAYTGIIYTNLLLFGIHISHSYFRVKKLLLLGFPIETLLSSISQKLDQLIERFFLCWKALANLYNLHEFYHGDYIMIISGWETR